MYVPNGLTRDDRDYLHLYTSTQYSHRWCVLSPHMWRRRIGSKEVLMRATNSYEFFEQVYVKDKHTNMDTYEIAYKGCSYAVYYSDRKYVKIIGRAR